MLIFYVKTYSSILPKLIACFAKYLQASCLKIKHIGHVSTRGAVVQETETYANNHTAQTFPSEPGSRKSHTTYLPETLTKLYSLTKEKRTLHFLCNT